MSKRKKNAKNIIFEVMVYVIVILGSIFMLLPFYWMVSTSLKDINSIFIIPPQWIPKPFHWENYKKVFELLNFGKYYLNSVIVTAGRVIGMFFTCTMAGYAFARLKFPGNKILFFILLSSLMIPFEVLMVPTFILMKNLHWINTYRALIIPQALGAFGGVFNVFLMKQFFSSIPKELEEAAIIEGAGPFRIFWSIMLPMVKPALAALLIFSFTSAWNDFTYPLIITNTDNMKVLSLGIAGFKGFREGMTQWDLMMAASTISILPIIVVFIFAQKYFVEGITTTGLKG